MYSTRAGRSNLAGPQFEWAARRPYPRMAADTKVGPCVACAARNESLDLCKLGMRLRGRERTAAALEAVDQGLRIGELSAWQLGWVLAQAGFMFGDLGLSREASALLERSATLLARGMAGTATPTRELDHSLTRLHSAVRGLDCGRISADAAAAELQALERVLGGANSRRRAQLAYAWGELHRSRKDYDAAAASAVTAIAIDGGATGGEACEWALLRARFEQSLESGALCSGRDVPGETWVKWARAYCRVLSRAECPGLRRVMPGSLAQPLYMLAGMCAMAGRPSNASELLARAMGIVAAVWAELDTIRLASDELRQDWGAGAPRPAWHAGAPELVRKLAAEPPRSLGSDVEAEDWAKFCQLLAIAPEPDAGGPALESDADRRARRRDRAVIRKRRAPEPDTEPAPELAAAGAAESPPASG